MSMVLLKRRLNYFYFMFTVKEHGYGKSKENMGKYNTPSILKDDNILCIFLRFLY